MYKSLCGANFKTEEALEEHVTRLFLKGDIDDSGGLDFEEFMSIYNDMTVDLMDWESMTDAIASSVLYLDSSDGLIGAFT